jgi:hypothetical protein
VLNLLQGRRKRVTDDVVDAVDQEAITFLMEIVVVGQAANRSFLNLVHQRNPNGRFMGIVNAFSTINASGWKSRMASSSVSRITRVICVISLVSSRGRDSTPNARREISRIAGWLKWVSSIRNDRSAGRSDSPAM